ncbi:MAG: hypothetical protein KGI28_00630 [Thaumarchaeota archaeon]|nr:hypothetical protein [Nitrososphaerota archaeon]
MKFIVSLLILAILGLYISHSEQAFAQQSACQPQTVCVHPGDMLKYSITLNSANSTQTFNFGDMIDASHIRVIEQDQIGNSIQNYTMILNLNTGYESGEQDSTITHPFLQVLASPMDYNKSDTSIAQATTDFNGFNRTSLVEFHPSGSTTSKTEYDTETGILLDEQATSLVTIGKRMQIVDISNTLVDTNIINSDSSGNQALTNTISIPSWVKNNAKYWNDDSIDDTAFAQGIQYMIKQGMITIPPVQSGQASPGVTIPKWVKQDAGFWADGQISDRDFVKGVQWLITNGIIQVN